MRLFDENDQETTKTRFIETPTTATDTTLNELSPIEFERDNFTPFTPNTFEYLEKEIMKNKENLDNLEVVCKDPEIWGNIREKFLDERKYFVSQQEKHMQSILEQAKRTDINDVDADRLIREIDSLKDKVDKLSKDAESIKHRTLDSMKETDTVSPTDNSNDNK